MSVFPKRTQQNGEVIIHVRRNSSKISVFENTRVFVIDPLGHRHLADHREVWVHPKTKNKKKKIQRKISEDILSTTPAAVFAQYLSQEDSSIKWLQGFFEESASSTHNWYFSYRLDEDAIPGRYEVHLECISQGRISDSSTKEFDHFYVDKIDHLQIKKMQDKQLLTLKNCSSEPTPINMYEIFNDSKKEQKVSLKTFIINGNVNFKITTKAEKVFLSYKNMTDALRISLSQEPFIQRTNKYLYLQNMQREEVYLIESSQLQEKMALVLSGEAKDIWLRANGLVTKSEIRNKKNKDTYDWMKKKGLLLERPVNNKKCK